MAKIWKQTACPSNTWMNKDVGHKYTQWSVIQSREKITYLMLEPYLLFATTWMDLGSIMLREISETEWCTLYNMWNLKKPNPLKQTRMVVTRGMWWGKREDGGQVYKPAVIRWIQSGDLMCSRVATVSNSVLYAWKLLIEWISNVLTTKKKW